MNPTDAILLGVLAVAAARGAVRGFVSETMGVAAIVIGFAGAALLATPVTTFLGAELRLASPLREAAGFVAGFCVVYLPVLLIGALVAGFWRRGFAGVVNRAGGLVVGSLKWALVLALMLVALDAGGARGVLPGRDESRVAAALAEALTVPLRVADQRGDQAEG
jgi:membrane protein required for colicin V production